MKKTGLLLLLPFLSFLLAGCDLSFLIGGNSQRPEAQPGHSEYYIKLEEDDVTVTVGEYYSFSYTTNVQFDQIDWYYDGGDEIDFYHSYNEVYFYARNEGTVYVTAYYRNDPDNVYDTCKVTIKPYIYLDFAKNKLDVYVGDTFTLDFYYGPDASSFYSGFYGTCDTPNVIRTVSVGDGYVTLEALGETTCKYTIHSRNYLDLYSTITINVLPPVVPLADRISYLDFSYQYPLEIYEGDTFMSQYTYAAIYYVDGSKEDFPYITMAMIYDNGCPVSLNSHIFSSGEHTLTWVYEGYNAECSIYVHEKEVDPSATLNYISANYKTMIYYGDLFSSASLYVLAYYSDGSVRNVSNQVDIYIDGTLYVGDEYVLTLTNYSIAVTFMGKVDSFTLVVNGGLVKTDINDLISMYLDSKEIEDVIIPDFNDYYFNVNSYGDDQNGQYLGFPSFLILIERNVTLTDFYNKITASNYNVVVNEEHYLEAYDQTQQIGISVYRQDDNYCYLFVYAVSDIPNSTISSIITEYIQSQGVENVLDWEVLNNYVTYLFANGTTTLEDFGVDCYYFEFDGISYEEMDALFINAGYEMYSNVSYIDSFGYAGLGFTFNVARVTDTDTHFYLYIVVGDAPLGA